MTQATTPAFDEWQASVNQYEKELQNYSLLPDRCSAIVRGHATCRLDAARRRLADAAREAIPHLIAMVRQERQVRLIAPDELVKAEARATAAEERVRELEKALDTIARGRYDGLEITHYSADECRNIARAALRR